MTGPFDSLVLRFIVRVFMAPFIFLFGLYVLAHGENSPGGGFQAGAIMAAGVLLLRLAWEPSRAQRCVSTRAARVMASLGLAIFVGTGLVPLFTGSPFLDYEALPVPGIEGSELRSLGVFIVELGIALGVMGIMVSIFDYLAERETDAG